MVDVAAAARPVAGTVEELLAGASDRRPFTASDSKSGSRFERVTIDGVSHVVKYLHVDHDWTMRASGDLGQRTLGAWRAGLMDTAPDIVDHAVVGMAGGWGRNGWGSAILMRDVEKWLVAPGDDTLAPSTHAALVQGMAALCARGWGWEDRIGLMPYDTRWRWFADASLAVEQERGFPDPVPRIAMEGWRLFGERAPAATREVVGTLRRDPWVLVERLRATPSTFLHGDWKLGNLGLGPDGRVILLDWAYPGEGPACHELGWYLAINRARLPESKEATIERFRAGLEACGIDTAGWWERQLGLCLLGTLVQFGWEKALGDADELDWWCDQARQGARWL